MPKRAEQRPADTNKPAVLTGCGLAFMRSELIIARLIC